jgi:hypothetical protein
METESTWNMNKLDKLKNWNELDANGRIERMHSTVYNLLEEVKDLQKRIHLLEHHQHGNDGGLLVSYNDHHWRF